MDLLEKKKEILDNLEMLLIDVKYLDSVLPEMIEKLIKVKTEQDAKIFDDIMRGVLDSLDVISL